MSFSRSRLLLIGLAAATLIWEQAISQSHPSSEMFAGTDVVHGISIPQARCRLLERDETAVWVAADGKGACLRYYAYGLKPASQGNPVAAGWFHGDVVGSSHPTNTDKHQKGLGVAAMVAQERALSERYRVPFAFLARPGAYGSAGHHPTDASTKHEANLVAAEVGALAQRYGIRSWVLGGHSGGGTLVSELIARRRDIRCAVISSGAGAHRAYLEAHGAADEITREELTPIDNVDKVPTSGLRVIVMGDPRDGNVFFPVQQLYYLALRSHGVTATLLPLMKGLPDEYHSLVTLAEAATGLCAEGEPTPRIAAALHRMPSQQPRISN